jgi:hypothetical protein
MKKLFVLATVAIVFLLIPGTITFGQDVIFQEDFDSSTVLDNWLDMSADGGQYTIDTANGVLVSTQPVHDDIGWLAYIGIDLNFPDSFEITFRARKLQAGPEGVDFIKVAFHFFDHLKGVPHRVFTGWRQASRNDFYLQVWWEGTRTRELVQSLGFDFDETQWHTVKVVKNGLRVSAFINDTEIYTESIPEISPFLGTGGTIALQGGDGKFEFDDLVVTIPTYRAMPGIPLLLLDE